MLIVSALLCCISISCAPTEKPPPTTSKPTGQPARPIIHDWQLAPGSGVQGAVQPLGAIANCGFQLPVVSPDGQWIAYLETPQDVQLDVDAVISGHGLQDASLWLRAVERNAEAMLVCRRGAAWPAWSADSQRLVFIAYDRNGACSLRIHDVAAMKTRRVGVGLQHMMMPAVHPDGQTVMVSAYAQVPDRAIIHRIDLNAVRAEPIAADVPAPQLWPRWLDRNTFVMLGRDGDRLALLRCDAAGTSADLIVRTGMKPSVYASVDALSIIARPLSANGRHFARYDRTADRIIITDLTTGASRLLPSGARAGCWMGPDRFAAATDSELLIVTTETGLSQRVLNGAFLPRWADKSGHQLICCARSQTPATFELARLHLVADQSR